MEQAKEEAMNKISNNTKTLLEKNTIDNKLSEQEKKAKEIIEQIINKGKL